MRTSRVHNALIAAVAGPALVLAIASLPVHAQTMTAATRIASAAPVPNAGGSLPPASLAVPLLQQPPDVSDAAVDAGASAPLQQASTASLPVAAPASTDGTEAAPVAPDAPVAAANLPAPGAAPTTAADAALNMANMMDGAGGGISNADLMSALENAAAAGQPMALWRLGTMYENGDGVAKDDVKAFGYFSQIANDHADAAPRGVDSDIVAQSFVKMGDYYRQGLPDAGIQADPEHAEQLVLHAATYFGNADAQYRVGELYLKSTQDPNPLQGARWLSLAAHKGHLPAQARLGDLLFNGAGIKAQPAEGLMWLTIAHDRAAGTPDEHWINELLTRDMSVATPDQRAAALKMATAVEPQFGPADVDETPGE